MVAISPYPPLAFAPHRLPVTHHGSLTLYWWDVTTHRLKTSQKSKTPILGQCCLFLISHLYWQFVCVCLELASSLHAHSAVWLWRQMLFRHESTALNLNRFFTAVSRVSLCISVASKCLQCKCFSNCVCVWDVCREESLVYIWLLPGAVIMGVRGFLIG